MSDTVTLPQSAKPHLTEPEQETKRLIAMDRYKKGGVSVAWAATAAGMNRMDFASLLVDNNIPIRQQTAEEVMADVASLEELLGK
jgi:predicted HTH domain antitoxin